jgi:hypothetical protein
MALIRKKASWLLTTPSTACRGDGLAGAGSLDRVHRGPGGSARVRARLAMCRKFPHMESG